MKTAILAQIKDITAKLVRESFSIHQNFPALRGDDIVWSGFKDIAFTLKDQEYADIYYECLKERAYNWLLLDGAIVQMLYRFLEGKLVEHRLAFFPHPELGRYQESPDDFEEVFYGNELYVDMENKHVIVFPLRIDFDADQGKYRELDHSYSHATLGNYANCRIPVVAPVSPRRFINFLLRNFYFDRFKDSFDDDEFSCPIVFDVLISDRERKTMHLDFSMSY